MHRADAFLRPNVVMNDLALSKMSKGLHHLGTKLPGAIDSEMHTRQVTKLGGEASNYIATVRDCARDRSL